MKLLSLEMENYRRFVGKHKIEFANGDKENVTIIRAENGAGKTGILMALLFGLFGVERYDQFQIENEDDIMVSRPLLTLGKSVTAKVTVEFIDDNDQKYKIAREITANNLNGVVHQNNDNIKVKLLKDGLEEEQTKEQIDQFMNNLIGKNIRGFLFFDGVRYMDLFKKPSRESKKELKKIIEKMLNINDLDDTIKGINFLKGELTKYTDNKKLSAQKSEALNEKYALEEKIKKLDDQISDKENQNDSYKNSLSIHQEKMNELDEFAEIAKEVENLKRVLKETEKQIGDIEGSIKNGSNQLFTANILYLFGNEVREDLEQYAKSNTQTRALINGILESNKCICCDDELSPERRANILNYLNSLDESIKNSSSIASLNADFALQSISNAENSGDLYREKSSDLYSNLEKVDELNKKISYYNDLLPVNESKTITSNLKEAQMSYTAINTRIEANNEDIEIYKQKISEINLEIENVENKIMDIDRELAELNNEKEKFALYNNITSKLKSLREEYLVEAQKNVSERANDYFRQLLSDDDRASIEYLKINKDYQIEAYNYFGQEIFADLSAGQKLLAAMAFTMGLTAVAAVAKPKTNFPLVMDTPMSNLDRANRKRLIKIMPTAVAQWILTPMDTEITNHELDVFIEGGSVGKVYSLIKADERSEIKEYSTLKDLKEAIQ